MKTSTLVLSISGAVGLAGAFAAWHHLPCECNADKAGAAPVTNVAFTAPAPVEAEDAKPFKVDNVHSALLFRIKHNGVAYFHGRFNTVSGEFNLNAEDASKSVLSITVKADSIDTNNSGRNDHLKSADFFSVAEHETITFVAKSMKKTGDHTFEATGDLTMLGKTKSITATIEHTGTGKGGRGGEVAGLETVFTVKRSDFDMTYGIDKGALGDEVRITASLEGGR